MPSVAFSKSGVGSLVTVSRGVSQDPRCRFWNEAWNAQLRFNADATFVGYNNGCKIIRGLLIINYISKAEADALQYFFSNTIRFISSFKIYLSAAGGADLGKGSGEDLEICHIDTQTASTNGIITPQGKGNKFNLELPYICLDNVTALGSFP